MQPARLSGLILAALLASPAVAADEKEVLFNRVYLEVQAQRNIPNDEMQVILVTEHQGRSPQEIAGRVNVDMAWALDHAKRQKGVEARTRAYQTQPLYEKQTIVGWQSSQQLQLISEDTATLTGLIGRLQERLQVRQMQFMPTRQTREKHAEELIEEALEGFKRRVAVIGRHMDGKDHRVVELHINTGGFQPIFPERAMMRAMDAAPAPAVEAGTSELTVTVSGSVQFY
jgi:predicted secreted protein